MKSITGFKNKFHKNRFKKYLNTPLKPSKEELEETKKLYQTEFSWWGDIPPFKTERDMEKEFSAGNLVKIGPDKNMAPIMRFQNPDLKQWLPYLDKNAASLIKEVGKRWRENADKEDIPKSVRLSVTSLTRSVKYQRKIVKMGKLAVKKSSHTKGKSFDIDGCGYYEGDKIINPRFTKNYKNSYNPKVHKILKNVLEEMKKEGKLNFITEFEGTDNQTFHVTVAPKK